MKKTYRKTEYSKWLKTSEWFVISARIKKRDNKVI